MMKCPCDTKFCHINVAVILTELDNSLSEISVNLVHYFCTFTLTDLYRLSHCVCLPFLLMPSVPSDIFVSLL